jgi:hypothetical protein
MYVEDSPDHPYRVGVTRVDENCQVTDSYEDLSAKEFGALIAQARDEGAVTIAPLPLTALTGSPDAILAATSTQKIRGYHHGQHLGKKMVEVRSELRWWYNGIDVTSYGEGLCGRWNGSCWNPSGSLGCWWEADDMPDWIDIVAQSSFSVAPLCWAGCPGCGGWLKVTTTGDGSGTHGAYCQHGFSAPAGSTWYCYHVHL